jgi:hypothetical protein
MVRNLGKTFCEILGWVILGMFWKNVWMIFLLFPKDGPKVGKTFCEILGWVVFGDVLNNLFW